MTISPKTIRKEIIKKREMIASCENLAEKEKLQREINTLEKMGARISISDVAERIFKNER